VTSAEMIVPPLVHHGEGPVWVARDASLYWVDMAYDEAPGAGTSFRLDPDESTHVVLTDVTVSNGLAWSPEGATVYYVDSPTQRIDAFDFGAAAGAFENRRTVVEIDPGLGSPDGLTADGEGGLWVALWNGAAVHRYAPDGRLDEAIELPTPKVSARTFGGQGLDQLIITTSALGMNGTQELAGAVFRAEPGVAGLPAICYGA
jgi:sugar lactone lactonase YvrE